MNKLYQTTVACLVVIMLVASFVSCGIYASIDRHMIIQAQKSLELRKDITSEKFGLLVTTIYTENKLSRTAISTANGFDPRCANDRNWSRILGDVVGKSTKEFGKGLVDGLKR